MKCEKDAMKQACILVFVIFAVLHGTAQEQFPCVPCLPQGITFTTQSQIDNFPINYPNCTQIGGTVEVNGNMVNLLGLHDVESIGGDLIFDLNTNLTNLSGLNTLKSIGIALYVNHNFALTSLTGLNNLTSIGNGIFISTNAALTSLDGLENLTSLGMSLEIEYNNMLANLTGLNSLTSIPGYMRISSNYAMTNLTGLDNLNQIGGRLDIRNNPALTSLTGLEGVTSIGEDLIIANNYILTSVTGLSNIKSGTIEDLVIKGNFDLSDCAVQSICDYLVNPMGTIEIHDNAAGCNGVEEVKDSCGITSVSNPDPESSLTIYPNPASTTITIETPAKGSLSIHNTSGQIILQREIIELTTTIDVGGWKKGVYVVKVVGERGVQQGKMVKW